MNKIVVTSYMCTDNKEKQLMENVLGTREMGRCLKKDTLVLRKETIPLLHEYFERRR